MNMDYAGWLLVVDMLDRSRSIPVARFGKHAEVDAVAVTDAREARWPGLDLRDRTTIG